MGLDIRFPIGMMFTLIGLLLTGTGLFTCNDAGFYKISLGININLLWGAFLLLFGGLMWGFAILEKKKSK
jgi:hypothetical protein